MSDQPQPVRTGDVYPPSASAHDARRQRDEVLGTHGGDQQQNQDGDLRVTEADEPHAGRRVVTATAGGQVMAQFTVPVPGAGVEEVATREDAVAVATAAERNAAAGGGGGGGGKGVANAVAAAAEMNERRMTRRRQA
uniref:SMP domain-containing protein n=1 Tax=Hordeum vulgare subsp. vulgare TaxID=112509 RepID=A0A8I6XHF5_HORVV